MAELGIVKRSGLAGLLVESIAQPDHRLGALTELTGETQTRASKTVFSNGGRDSVLDHRNDECRFLTIICNAGHFRQRMLFDDLLQAAAEEQKKCLARTGFSAESTCVRARSNIVQPCHREYRGSTASTANTPGSASCCAFSSSAMLSERPARTADSVNGSVV